MLASLLVRQSEGDEGKLQSIGMVLIGRSKAHQRQSSGNQATQPTRAHCCAKRYLWYAVQQMSDACTARQARIMIAGMPQQR